MKQPASQPEKVEANLLAFADDILSVGVPVGEANLKDPWHSVVIFHLRRAFDGLEAIRLVTANQLHEPAVVLTRYLFELAVTLRYLAKSPEERVPSYVGYYRALEVAEGQDKALEKARRFMEQQDYVGASKELLPGKPWKSCWAMCKEIGCLDHFYTMYRATSEVAHSGAHQMGSDMLELMGIQTMKPFHIPVTLFTAIDYFRWVAQTSTQVLSHLGGHLPFDSTWGERIGELEQEVREIVDGYSSSNPL